MSAEPLRLQAGRHLLELGRAPLLIGVIDDPSPTLAQARGLLAAGAQAIELGCGPPDIGNASISPAECLQRIDQTIAAISDELDAIVAIHAGRPAAAQTAVDAGAAIVFDESAGGDPQTVRICARTGAALVIRCEAVEHAGTALDADRRADGLDSLRRRIATALAGGVSFDQLIVEVPAVPAGASGAGGEPLLELGAVTGLGRPVLVNVCGRGSPPASAGTRTNAQLAVALAKLADGLDQGAHMFRLRDVAAARDFIAVRAALDGELDPGRDLVLADELRHER